MSPLAEEDDRKGLQDDFKIQPQAHVADVVQVEHHHLLEGHGAAAQGLPDSRAAGKRGEPFFVPVLVALPLVGQARPRTHQGHVPFENVEELREFVQAGLADELAEGKDAGVVGDLEHLYILVGTLDFTVDEILDVFLVDQGVAVDVHRPKFVKIEASSVSSDAGLPVQNGPLGRELDADRNDQKKGREQDDRHR